MSIPIFLPRDPAGTWYHIGNQRITSDGRRWWRCGDGTWFEISDDRPPVPIMSAEEEEKLLPLPLPPIPHDEWLRMAVVALLVLGSVLFAGVMSLLGQ